LLYLTIHTFKKPTVKQLNKNEEAATMTSEYCQEVNQSANYRKKRKWSNDDSPKSDRLSVITSGSSS